MDVRRPEALQLRVEVREVSPLQKRIVGKVYTWNHGLCAESDLLRFRKEVVDRAVEHHSPHATNREYLFRNYLRGIEDVEVETICELLVEKLQTELPLRGVSSLDRLPEVAAM